MSDVIRFPRLRPVRRAGRGVRRAVPPRRAAEPAGVRRPPAGDGRRDPRDVPGPGRGRTGRGRRPAIEAIAAAAARRAASQADRRLPDRPRDRPGRDGGRLRGRADLAGPPRGAEGPARAGGRRPEGPGAVPPRGPGRGAAAPHQHRAGLRGRPGGRVRFYAMQFIQGQGLDVVIDELRRLLAIPAADQEPRRRRRGARTAPASRHVDPRLEVAASDPDRAVRPGARPDRPSRTRAARSLPEDSGTAGTGGRRAGFAGQTERFDADATAGDATLTRCAGPTRPRRPHPVVELGGACPGGTQVSRSRSGRRQPFFRSVAQIGRQAPRAWPTPTPAGSSTATSSRRTCCWTPTGWSGSPTSAWPRRTTRA